MTRRKGTFEMESNVEPALQAPLDARSVVPNKSDLTDSTNFTFPYIGMIVSVQSEGIAYLLTDMDTTTLDNWKPIGEGTAITVDDAMSETSENPVQNKVITAALADKADKTELDDYYTKAEADALLDGKQDELTAGDNVAILSDPYTGTTVISATDTTYTAGEGLALDGTEFLADTSVMATKQDLERYYNKTETDALLDDKADKADTYTKTETDTLLDGKQDELTAGNNISIVTDPYTNTTVISADDPDLSNYYDKSETDALLSDKADKTDLDDYYTKTEANTLLDGKQDELTAGENISIVEDPYTGTTVISATGGSDGKVGEDITTNIAVGGLASGSSIDKDDTITSVLKRMLVTTYYPTFTPPSASITYGTPALAKVGSNISAMAASVVFNAGAIMLQGTKQADRAGAATNYSIATSGAATEYSDSNTTGSFNMPALTRNSKGNITITGTVEHAAGPQPKDSDGNDYGSPLAAGSVTATKTVEFILPFYFGVSNGMTVTDFTGFTEVLEKKGQKQYTYVTNNQHFVIAYDASYGDLTSILDPNNFETKGSWTKSSLTVDGQQYNVYVAQTATTNPGAKYTFKF